MINEQENIQNLSFSKGQPYPFGTTISRDGINFALIAANATEVILSLFDHITGEKIGAFFLSPETNKTGEVWHIFINGLKTPILYGYQILPKFKGTSTFLLDPYAKAVSSGNLWGRSNRFSQNSTYFPLGVIFEENPSFSWENDTHPQIPIQDLILYETHIRGFTQHSSSKVRHPGTFLGFIEKIPYLVDLGINAVELLPINEFNESEYLYMHPQIKKNLYNYWGYSTVNFFSVMNRYASSDKLGSSINEFKLLVKELHRNNIEVIVDVVFNHTAEGGEKGPVLSFKGLNNSIYYMLKNDDSYLDFSGCGNTFNANHPVVQEFIINCLRYWVTEMHVDGFRFDLTSALTRGLQGEPLSKSPLIKAITDDPLLANIKLIAEPWDAAGLYQVGNFAAETPRWLEWNGKYRDTIRRYLKGSSWTHGDFARRICGSEDLYHNRTPCNSINFYTCHDGFTLADLVSYNNKHNLENGEDNRDGMNENDSWNCGYEGPTINRKVITLRERQMKNFHLALMISRGIPLLLMGDEYGHTKNGNNNTWCQDNELNWFLWGQLETNASFFRFYRSMIYLRKQLPILRQKTFLTSNDIDWHGLDPYKPDWNTDSHFVAFTLKDHVHDRNLYIAFNSYDHAVTVQLPPPPHLRRWRWIVNTSEPHPLDFFEDDQGPLLLENSVKIPSHSAILLKVSF